MSLQLEEDPIARLYRVAGERRACTPKEMLVMLAEVLGLPEDDDADEPISSEPPKEQ
jgi:hypothetical protein